MYGRVLTAIVRGIDGMTVTVEADVSEGLPVFDMVGFLSSEAREARERVRTALRSCGFSMPVKRITVNIAPASVRKTGTGFDLPTALAVLMAEGQLPGDACEDTLIAGELQLSGRVKYVRGVLPMLLAAKEDGIKKAVIPKENAAEASLVSGMEIKTIDSLPECIAYLCPGLAKPGLEKGMAEFSGFGADIAAGFGRSDTAGSKDAEDNVYRVAAGIGTDGKTLTDHGANSQTPIPDFADICGQARAKRACEIAAAGRHNLLMIGPPGSGKSLIARCIPGILPPMSEKMQMELARIRSVSGLDPGDIHRPPFRNPHHTITDAGMAGGGQIPHPGELSLAHGGVLFLDELPEFARTSLEVLRQPMEEGEIRLIRQGGAFCFPADFMLVAAMNPCPCGYYPNRRRCRCTPSQVQRYLSRISQPLLDRIDVSVDVNRMSFSDLDPDSREESSEEIRKRVLRADEIQKKRYAGLPWRFNSQIPGSEIRDVVFLGQKERSHMEKRYEALSLTARGYHRMLRVARTIADLEGSERVEIRHLIEAEMYKSADLLSNQWEY